jgi:hypothetical protein
MKNLFFFAGLNSTSADAMIMIDIANAVLGTLLAELKIPKVTTRAFDAQAQGANIYRVPVITQGDAKVRSVDSDVVDDNSVAVSYQDITCKEMYYSLPVDRTFADSNAGNRVAQFIDNGAKKLLKQIEKYAYEQLAIFTGGNVLDWHYSTGTGLTYDDVRAAKKRMNKKEFLEYGRQMVLYTDCMDSLLDDSGLAYNATGSNESAFTGLPARPIQGFDSWQSPYIYNPNSGSVIEGNGGLADGALKGAIASTTTEDFVIDGITVPSGTVLVPGQVIKFGTEYIMVYEVTSNPAPGEWGFKAFRGVWGSTAATHLDDAVPTWMDSYVNLAIDPSSAVHVMPKQNTDVDNGIKVEASRDGFNVYLHREGMEKRNGSRRYLLSCVFGVKNLRPGDGAIQRIVKAG